MRESYPSDISREQFKVIKPLLESARRKISPRRVELYEMFYATLYLLRSGCQWRRPPEPVSQVAHGALVLCDLE